MIGKRKKKVNRSWISGCCIDGQLTDRVGQGKCVRLGWRRATKSRAEAGTLKPLQLAQRATHVTSMSSCCQWARRRGTEHETSLQLCKLFSPPSCCHHTALHVPDSSPRGEKATTEGIHEKGHAKRTFYQKTNMIVVCQPNAMLVRYPTAMMPENAAETQNDQKKVTPCRFWCYFLEK